MFISKADKQRIEAQLDTARHHIVLMESRITLLENSLKQLATTPAKKAKRPTTAAQKAKQREYQKAYNERKKAKQLAEGNTNVSA